MFTRLADCATGGWRTYGTGVCLDSCGGATEYLPTTSPFMERELGLLAPSMNKWTGQKFMKTTEYDRHILPHGLMSLDLEQHLFCAIAACSCQALQLRPTFFDNSMPGLPSCYPRCVLDCCMQHQRASQSASNTCIPICGITLVMPWAEQGYTAADG